MSQTPCVPDMQERFGAPNGLTEAVLNRPKASLLAMASVEEAIRSHMAKTPSMEIPFNDPQRLGPEEIHRACRALSEKEGSWINIVYKTINPGFFEYSALCVTWKKLESSV